MAENSKKLTYQQAWNFVVNYINQPDPRFKDTLEASIAVLQTAVNKATKYDKDLENFSM